MSKELVISANRHETKVAILEDDQLVEVFFQRANEYSLAGSIHKGRVTRVLPGMQSAFVDLGLDRDTFLYVSDFFEENDDLDSVPVGREESRPERPRGPVEPPAAVESAAPPEAAGEARGGTSEVAPAPIAPASNMGSQQQRHDDGDGRDRRGRRSRRRRTRGRGFPDSKYASTDSRYAPEPPREPRVVEDTPAAEPSVASPTAAPSGGGAFPVLPGESLAKYTRANIQPLDDAEEEEVRSLQESETVAEAESISEPVLEPEALAIVDEPGVTEPAVASEPVPEPGEPDTEAEAEAEAGVQEEIVEEDVAAEIEAAVEAQAAGESVASPAEFPQSETPAPQLSAQVREQGGRYMHRTTRRMRRRMRGSGPGDRGDAAPAGVESIVVRPEQSRGAGRPERAPMPSITELLKEGQEIIVQIAKEPLGQKGARITSHIALPGRYVVYMPTVEHTGVSRKIASDDERHRLKRILQVHHVGIPGGFIVQTAGAGRRADENADSIHYLANP